MSWCSGYSASIHVHDLAGAGFAQEQPAIWHFYEVSELQCELHRYVPACPRWHSGLRSGVSPALCTQVRWISGERGGTTIPDAMLVSVSTRWLARVGWRGWRSRAVTAALKVTIVGLVAAAVAGGARNKLRGGVSSTARLQDSISIL